MSSQQTFLEKAQSISTILSAIAIPIVLALTGYAVQRSIAEDGIKKDYLAMAVAMLRDSDKNLDPELRSWATAVVSRFSPVPFSSSAEEKLSRTFYIAPKIPPLIDMARQPNVEDICPGGCSESLTQKIGIWRSQIADAKSSESARVLIAVLDQSVEENKALAEALDYARISGKTCERLYDSLQAD